MTLSIKTQHPANRPLVVKTGTFPIIPKGIIKDFKEYGFKVEYTIERGHVFDATLEIYSINDQPTEFYSEDLVDLIDEEIRFHEFKSKEYSREDKEDQRFEESRQG
jgi:hypothetical protein